MDVSWPAGVGFELMAQVADVDAQDVQVIIPFPPYLAEELPVGEHFACINNKGPEDIIFGRCELDLLAIHRDQAICQVDC